MKNQKKGFVYGWLMVAVVFMCYGVMVCFPAQCLSIVVTPKVIAEGWDESIVGQATSFYYLTLTCILIPLGACIKRWGHKIVGIVCALITITAVVTLALDLIHDPKLWVCTFLLFGFMGAGVGTGACYTILLNWFHRRKALPMAIFGASGGVTGVWYPLLTQSVVTRFGYNAGWWLFFGMCCLGLTAWILIVRNKPEDVGEIADGRAWVEAHPEGSLKNEIVTHSEEEPSLKRCYRSIAFWVVSIQMFGLRSIVSGFSSYIILYATSKGVNIMFAAALVSMFNGMGILTRFTGALIADFFHLKKTVCNTVFYGMAAAGFILLYFAESPASFAIAALVIGLGFGWANGNTSVMEPELFGYSNIVIINSTLNTFGFAGATLMPIFIALLNGFGGYQYGYLGMGIYLVCCTVSSLFIRSGLVGSYDKKETN